ncbi:MAG: PorP/SprF family type IX secretion system membrane protein [Cyclobacteriaceae bacterium]
MKKILSTVLLGLILSCKVSITYAQEPPVFSQFFMNPFIYNPAYAGVEGHSVFFLMYRQQWANIDGAPAIYHASFHTPLPNGIGVGGSVFSQTQGLLTNAGIKGAASYLVNFDRTHFLRFGMSIGMGTSSINFDQLDDPTDPAFSNLANDEMYAIGEFGATYHTGHFNFGFALPSLFSQEITSQDDFTPIRVKPLDRALLKMNYRGHISDDFAIEPHVIYRYSKNSADQFEVATILHIKHIVWAGASYRQDAGMVGLIGAKIKEKIGFGYAYEMGKPDIANLTGNTHEIHIGFHLGSKKAHADHVSSFIKSHRLTAEERAAKAEEERLAALAALEPEEDTEVSEQEPELPQEDPESQNSTVVSTLTEDEEQALADAKSENKEAWVYKKPEASQAMTRVNSEGQAETAVVFQRVNEDGVEETVVDFIPAPEPGQKETWSIADPNTPPVERTNAEGEKEIGMTWIKTDDQGNEEEITKWSKVYTGEVNIDQLVDDIEGLQVADYEHTPVLKIEERLLPDEKVEELKIEFDNTAQSKEQYVAAQPDPIATADEGSPSTVEESNAPSNTTTDPQDIARAKRGSHMLELEAAYHIIAGAFSSFDNAEKYSDELFQNGFKEVKVGYLTERGYYYVVISSHADPNQGINERNRVRRNPTYKDVWLLNVER